LDHYLKVYDTPDKMGRLEFSDLQVRVLEEQIAVVTGRFKLTRSAAAGGDASGIFSLVWKKTAQGWKIVLDHSASD
jgi:ketosteroid isomerase-like protein